jgi:hypothetical protein
VANADERVTNKTCDTVLFVALCFSVLLLLISFKNSHASDFLNSDYFWPLAFFDDVFWSGGHLADWNLSNHTDFFPDKLVAVGIWALTGRSYDWFLIVYSALNYVLWIVVVRFIFGSYWVGVLSSIAALLLLNLGLGTEIFITPYFSSFHFMPMCLALLLCVSILRWKSKLIAFSYILLFAVFISDRLVILFCASYMASNMLFDFGLRRDWRELLRPLAVFGSVVAAALAFHDSIWAALTHVTAIPSTPIPELFKIHWGRRSERLAIICSTVLLLFLPVAIRAVRHRARWAPASAAVFAGALSIELIIFKAPLEARYLVLTAYFILASVAFAIDFLVQDRRFLWISPAVAACLFFIHKPVGKWIEPVPEHPLSICIKNIKKNHPLKSGIGTYWHTHEVNLAGNSSTPIRSFMNQLDYHFWVTSSRFALEDFNFLVSRDRAYRLDMDFIKATIGSDFAFVQRCDAADTDVYVLTPLQESKLKVYLENRYLNSVPH